jgi:predicted AAA+ superfamily ATPase
MHEAELLRPYNPWWEDAGDAFSRLPTFRRPIFDDIFRGLKGTPQIISITGPRRVGKSTIIRQMIRNLIEEDVDPREILYYSMDDPALFRADIDHDRVFDSIMETARKKAASSVTYIFLDEIQRFERWELYLKKYYDLSYPVRFAISGSASSPIFKKSRESLLGRIKDYHLLPFSFREYLLYKNRDVPAILAELARVSDTGERLKGMMAKHPKYADLPSVSIPAIDDALRKEIESQLHRFMIEGGFPEVWTLPDWESKQSYLFTNQVEKVLLEDLVLAVELRKPELLKKFYISLLQYPGREINYQRLSQDLGISRATIERYFPLLEMTDLVRHVEKFSKSAIKVRRGTFKCYLVDLALRNAVLRIRDGAIDDPATLGLHAENLVFNVLRKWEGTVGLSYYREKDSEVDFIVHTGAGSYWPIEVKYRENIPDGDLKGLRSFTKAYKGSVGLVVTRKWEDFGRKNDRTFCIPLPLFLLLLD